ncbi:MAG: hypothetical protein HN653_07985 [Candidatus Marinimicrobia bacterium]|jgi:hypothetical protein|nr:hypothetical protein [Candidatus Neomarinimicrobiota bacterium]MBT5440836.1 hypothetical protein [Candidatus Neomarinimicrobiota bacterium]MBT7525593.1 hypothetical protein [Candidatus Neomarinimicrobiota bacterium]
MTDINKIHSENQLSYNLDLLGLITIEKMYKWTKIVGILNITLGIVYSLSILFFSVPTFIMGIITIVMGSKLVTAANHFQFAVQNKDSESFTTAIDQLRQYFLINGILLIVTFVMIGILLIFISFFSSFIMDFLNDSGFDYSISSLTSLIKK